MNLIDRLIGQNVGDIGRACNLLCIPIGEIIGKSKWFGGDLTKYDIHCQCAWRLLDFKRRIIVASSDFYYPPSNMEWSESFQWDVKGGNLFDEIIAVFNASHKNLRIKSATIIGDIDLRIEFEGAVVFEAFADSSEEENWRILQRSPKSIHLVSRGNRLEIDSEHEGTVNADDTGDG